MRAFNIGSRWRVTEGSGLASNRCVTVIPWRELDWHTIPGMYQAPNFMREVAVSYDNGEQGFMFKNRLEKEENPNGHTEDLA